MTATLTERTYAVAWDWGDYPDDLIMHGRLQMAGDHLQRWNGFVCPFFTRQEIDRYEAHVAKADPDQMYGRVEWDGDTLILIDPTYDGRDGTVGIDLDPNYEPDRIEPTPDGLYPLGAFGWTWTVCPPDIDPDYELSFDEAEAIGRDGTGRDLDPRFPHTGLTLNAKETAALIEFQRKEWADARTTL